VSETTKLSPAAFTVFATLLRNGSGLVIGNDKLYLLASRLAPILRAEKLDSLDALAERLGLPNSTGLRQQVIEAMTTNESLFFRDDKPFTHVRTQALPRLHAARPPGAKIRIWSAAASSGQEAYSLAMIIAEQRASLGNRVVEILGTDIAREQLARARDGVYTQFEVQRGLPMQMLVKYFRKDGANWRVADALRSNVEFREWNLLGDPRSLGKFDIVFCRNVLIYFDAPTKGRVLASIAGQLAPDGVLFLGGAETVMGITDKFVSHPTERGVYQLAGGAAKMAMAG
jgi:chemotaxis protein methyltransferase CheR